MENVEYSLVAIVVLLAANAFFVAAEFALVKVRGYQLDQAVLGHRHGAALSLRMHRNLDAYLAACQLGITMASLGLGWVGEPAVAALLEPALSRVGVTGPALHTISFAIGFLIFSSLHIVVGEQVPKTYAIRKPTPVTLSLAYPLHWFYLLVFPLNWLLDRANGGILRLLGVRDGPHHEIISEDEISAIVDKSEAHGEIEEKTADIIRKAFRFDDQLVREVMVPWVSVDRLYINATADENKAVVLETLHSRFPVEDATGDIVGVLNTKDLTTAILEGDGDVWRSLESRCRPPLVVPETLRISLLLEQMRSTRTHMAIVVDEHGTYIGIATLEDMLEEIVGEIQDEWDTGEADVQIEAVGAGWRVSGRLPLPVLENVTGATFAPTRNVTTVGGLLMERIQRVPQQDDQFREAGFIFRVEKMDGHLVKSILISRRRKGERDDASATGGIEETR